MMICPRALARTSALAVMICVVVPALALAQATIAGVVRDVSGAVLPGVTVEAASPALIEKVRSAVTDGNGQYRVVDLRPGNYSVTFTLPGFSTVRQEGLDLAGSFTATVNAEMRVGGIEETVTVTGEAPTVDVQSTTGQKVISREIIDAVPTGRNVTNLAVLVPGVTLAIGGASGTRNQDVGGSAGNEQVTMTVHGSRGGSQRIMQNGISVGNAQGQGAQVGAMPNATAVQEMTIDTSGGSAENGAGGVRVNIIPREGSNIFNGTVFTAFANGSLQGSNFTQELKDRGLVNINSLKLAADVNPGFGGPLLRDQLWFYSSLRYTRADDYVAGMFYNRNAGNPAAWTYAADTTRPAYNEGLWKGATARVTWQVSPRNKVAVSYDQQDRCRCPFQVTATNAPEASSASRFPLQRSVQADWSSPLTNRLLLEVVGIQRIEGWGFYPVSGFDPTPISVTEQSSGMTYRARATHSTAQNENVYYRAALSYITGSHSFKVGFNDGQAGNGQTTYSYQPLSYRLNNGVPNQITVRATPFTILNHQNHDLGIYAQDRWTLRRLTVNLGVRFDYFATSFPEQPVGPSMLTPARDLVFPATDNLAWKDITPRFGAAYDLFGTGRTALKVSINKYVEGQALGTIVSASNPVSTLVTSTTRNWNDANRNFVADCDLANPTANGECAGVANSNFGGTQPGTTYDPRVLQGWNSREYNWEMSAGIQHELMPRLSIDVGYFRRSYGNMLTTDNRSVTAADYDRFDLPVPANTKLPDGGGYTVGGVYTLKPTAFGRALDQYVTFASDYGKQLDQWQGMDITTSARLQGGLLVQGGLSTGRTTTDVCEVALVLPETLTGALVLNLANPVASLPFEFCRQVSPFATQYKGLATYTIPGIGVQASASLQSVPGRPLPANYNAPNAVITGILGRPLAGGAPNQTVNIVEPGATYSDRLTQLDLRFAKVLRSGRMRANVGIDVYNAFNSSAVLTDNLNFAVWRAPTEVVSARFAKLSLQLDF